MTRSNLFYVDVKAIRIAHEYVLDRVHKCEYPRGRGSYGLIYALGGKAEYRFLGGDRFTVSEGDVLFLSPNSAYTIVTEKAFRHYTVNFEIHEEQSCLELLSQPYCLLRGDNTEQQRRCIKKLIDLWGGKKTGYEMQAVGCLYELLTLFYADVTDSQSDQRLTPAREHIERNYDQPITLERLAKLSNMSVTNFRREWAKRYPDTPIQYRDSVRLYYAQEYLNSGFYTVSEIAKRCGMEDVSYFVRFFKKKTGMTPGEYKRNRKI